MRGSSRKHQQHLEAAAGHHHAGAHLRPRTCASIADVTALNTRNSGVMAMSRPRLLLSSLRYEMAMLLLPCMRMGATTCGASSSPPLIKTACCTCSSAASTRASACVSVSSPSPVPITTVSASLMPASSSACNVRSKVVSSARAAAICQRAADGLAKQCGPCSAVPRNLHRRRVVVLQEAEAALRPPPLEPPLEPLQLLPQEVVWRPVDECHGRAGRCEVCEGCHELQLVRRWPVGNLRRTQQSSVVTATQQPE